MPSHPLLTALVVLLGTNAHIGVSLFFIRALVHLAKLVAARFSRTGGRVPTRSHGAVNKPKCRAVPSHHRETHDYRELDL